MEPVTPTLLDLQRAFYRSLAERDDQEAAAWVMADGLHPAGRLAVYRNTMGSVLTNALRLAYPAVHRLVGAEFFAGAARQFIEDGRLPHSADLDEYGADFADFLAAFPPAASLGYLPDVARLEWLVNRALHAPAVDALDLTRVADLDETDRARVCFVPHPSVGLMRSDYPVDLIWRSVLHGDDAAMAAIDLAAGPVWLLVQRVATGIDVQRMSEPAWHFTAGLCLGRPLHAVLDLDLGCDASALLAEHLDAGRFISFALADALGVS